MTTRTRFSLICLILAIELLALTPLAANFFLTTRDDYKQYILLPVGSDQLIYENHLLQASEGVVAFRDRMTTEPQPVGVVNIFWLAIGNIGRFLRTSPLVTFTLARLAFLPLLIFTIFFLAKKVFSDETNALRATIFATALSGLGYLFATNDSLPTDFLIQTSTIANHIFASPHYLAATSLIILINWFFYRWSETKSQRALFVSGFLTTLLLAFQPYFLPMILATPLLWLVIRRRMLTRADGLPIFLFFAACMPPVVYFGLLVKLDPFTALRLAPNVTMTTDLWRDVLALSPLVVLAAIGFRRHRHALLWQYLALWVTVSLVMSHLPIRFNLRYLQGAFVPLGFAAYVGGIEVLNRFRAHPVHSFAARALLAWCLFSGTGVAIIVNLASETIFSFPPGFTEVLHQLQSLPSSVILAEPAASLFAAGRTDQRAYVAHWSDTIDFDQKRATAQSLLFTRRPSAETLYALQSLGIRYVIAPHEATLDTTRLKMILQNQDFTLLEVPDETSQNR